MGKYNNGMSLPEMLQKKICPFCKQGMIPFDSPENRIEDSFEYKCYTCNPNVIISLAGSLIPNIENTIKKNSMKFSYFQRDIVNCKDEIIKFSSEMF